MSTEYLTLTNKDGKLGRRDGRTALFGQESQLSDGERISQQAVARRLSGESRLTCFSKSAWSSFSAYARVVRVSSTSSYVARRTQSSMVASANAAVEAG